MGRLEEQMRRVLNKQILEFIEEDPKNIQCFRCKTNSPIDHEEWRKRKKEFWEKNKNTI